MIIVSGRVQHIQETQTQFMKEQTSLVTDKWKEKVLRQEKTAGMRVR